MVLKTGIEYLKGVVKRFKSAKESDQKCETLTKRLQSLQEKAESCLQVINDYKDLNVEELKTFIQNVKTIQDMCNKYLGKGNVQKAVAIATPFIDLGKPLNDIENELSLAENNFNMFVSVNNLKLLSDVYKLQKRTHKLMQVLSKEHTEMKETNEKNFKTLHDDIENVKSQLADIHKALDEQKVKQITFEQKQIEDHCQVLCKDLDQLTKRLPQQAGQQSKILLQHVDHDHAETMEKLQHQVAKKMEMIDQNTEKIKHLDQKMKMVMQMQDVDRYTVAKCPDRCRKIVTILRNFKRGPKLIVNAVNSVQVFFKCGFAGLKLYTENRSSEERMKHLQENSKRQNMSKSYTEKYRYHIQLVANESSDS